jgi:membrane associated rhomboid family serine protease
MALYGRERVAVEMLCWRVSIPVWAGLGCWLVFASLGTAESYQITAHAEHVAGIIIGFLFCKIISSKALQPAVLANQGS